jgi:hypothetical protein
VSWVKLTLMGAAGVLVLLNAFTTRRLWLSDQFEQSQKRAQTILIWLLPGAFLIVRLLLSDRGPRSDSDATAGPSAHSAVDQGTGHHSE